MWLLSQTGKKLKQLATRSNKADDKLKETEYFQKIDALLKEKSNVVSLTTLEWFVKCTATNPDQCQTLSDVLFLKLDNYVETNRRNKKMFKTLVIIDYILLNGVSVFIDLFNERIRGFVMIAEQQNDLTSTADKQFEQLIVRKAEHIVKILKDKQLRLLEKERVQNARLHILKKNKENLYNSQQQYGEVETKINDMAVQQLGRLGRIEKYFNDKIEKLAIALIGIIDEDCVLYVNSEANKEFMDRGESIIGQVQNQTNQIRNKEKSLKQLAKEQNKTSRPEVHPGSLEKCSTEVSESNQPKKIRYQNLLGIQIELL